MAPLLIALLLAGPMASDRSVVTQPSWIQRPTMEDFNRVTPYREDPPSEAQVLLVCRITAAGGLEACIVRDETPAGLGYGSAALALAPSFRMPEVDHEGRPVAGRTVQIPIIWKFAPD
jgi:hypothetical protein